MNNLDELQLRTKKKVNPKVLKLVIVVILVCGSANTYVMALLWYMRGWNPAYVGFGLLGLGLVCFAATQWPDKEIDNIPDLEYIEEDDRFNPDQHI